MDTLTIKTAVITGPTGSIGLALCKELLARGAKVYGVHRPDSPRALELPSGVIAVRCDLTELACLPEMISGGADAFFHLGWVHTIGPGRDDMHAQTENIRCALDAVDAAKALGCRVFVGAGSQGEHGRIDGLVQPDTPCFPITGYGIAKLCAGQMTRIACRQVGMRHEWARILSVYGPGDGPRSVISITAHALLRGERPSLTAGEQQWDYLYAADAARGLIAMGERGRDGAIYPLGSGRVQLLREYLEELRNQIDPALPLGFGDIPYGSGQVMHLQADLTALSEDTGFTPQTDFTQGIRETIEWYRRKESNQS